MESGGEAASTALSSHEATAERVWALWRTLKGYFPAWSLLPSSFYTPGAWTMWGIDLLSGFRRNRNTRQSFNLLKDAPVAEFEGVVALAALNQRRQGAIFQATAVAYVTVPLTLLATGAEIAPEQVEQLIRDNLTVAIQMFAGTTVGVLYYFSGWWRARQMMAVLDLIRIERGMLPNTALELRDAG